MKFATNPKYEGKQIEVEKTSKTSCRNKKSKGNDKAPAWFKQFANNLNIRLDNIEQRLDNIEQRLDNLEYRIKNIVAKNNLKE